MRRALPILAIAVVLSGCWPELKVAEPRAHIAITDESGAPIDGARVMVITQQYFLGPTHVHEFLTDSKGVVDLRPQRQWVIEGALPDASVWFDWTFCVEKAGYRAVQAPLEHSRKATAIVLEPSVRKSTCEPPDQVYPHVRVVEVD